MTSDIIGKVVVDNHVLPQEQRAMRKGVWGTMDCLMADEAITKWSKVSSKKLSVAWIDYQKAFDSIPHELIIWILDSLGLNPRIRDMIARLIPKWVTKFSIRTPGGSVSSVILSHY